MIFLIPHHGSTFPVNYDPVEVAGLYTFRGIDNAAYYALSNDGLTYWNNTGVGNQTRPNHTPTRRLIMDSLRFYVEELHVDGFRFDLAGILGEPDAEVHEFSQLWEDVYPQNGSVDYNDRIAPELTVLGDIIEEPLFQQQNTRMVSEPWTAGNSGPGIGGFSVSQSNPDYAWAEWNAHFRDWWRAFVNNCNEGNGWQCYGDSSTTEWALSDNEGPIDGGGSITGSEALYGWNGRKPYHSINFVTVHDGFTLYDMFSYTDKQNECGVLNPICCEDPTSAWCETNSGENHNRSFDWGMGREDMKRQQMRNLFAALFFSHGTPMILGGDEWMRTQYGNNNAYSDWADNEWNWFRWGEWQSSANSERSRMHDFVRNMTRMRREHKYAFAPENHGAGMPYAWKNPGNSGEPDWNGRTMMVHYYDDGNWDEAELLVMMNFTSDTVSFTLPTGRNWLRIVDTQSYFDRQDQGGYLSSATEQELRQSHNVSLDAPEAMSGSYGVQPFTIVIAKEEL